MVVSFSFQNVLLSNYFQPFFLDSYLWLSFTIPSRWTECLQLKFSQLLLFDSERFSRLRFEPKSSLLGQLLQFFCLKDMTINLFNLFKIFKIFEIMKSLSHSHTENTTQKCSRITQKVGGLISRIFKPLVGTSREFYRVYSGVFYPTSSFCSINCIFWFLVDFSRTSLYCREQNGCFPYIVGRKSK